MLKQTTVTAIISLLLINFSFAQPIGDENPMSAKPVIDKIVAQVGENIILHSDLEVQKLQAMNEGYTLTMDSDCRILEEMLYQNLLIHQAKIDSVEIPDGQVDAEMEGRLRQIEAQIGGRDKLEQFYGKTYSQIKDEFRDVIRERMMAQRMEEIITADIKVTPRDVRRLFEEIPTDSLPIVNDQIRFQQIVIFPKVSQRDKDATISQLRKWKNDIERGVKDFEAVARAHSEDPGSRKQGGRIQASRGMMVKPFEAAAFSLAVGEISDVVETEYGFHIIQLLDRRGDEYEIRHILKIPEVDRSAFSQAAALIEECARRLDDGEITWNQAVREYSEDEMTKQNLGIVTNPYSGEMFWDMEAVKQIEPELFAEINRMDVGMISSPIIFQDRMRNKEGVRIVRLDAKTPSHRANLKDDYSVIKRAAENKKKEEAVEQWVNEHIKSAYIRIDPKFSRCQYLYNW